MILHDRCQAFEAKITELEDKLKLAISELEYCHILLSCACNGVYKCVTALNIQKIKEPKNDHSK